MVHTHTRTGTLIKEARMIFVYGSFHRQRRKRTCCVSSWISVLVSWALKAIQIRGSIVLEDIVSTVRMYPIDWEWWAEKEKSRLVNTQLRISIGLHHVLERSIAVCIHQTYGLQWTNSRRESKSRTTDQIDPWRWCGLLIYLESIVDEKASHQDAFIIG